MRKGLSPLERRALLSLVSLIRDCEPDRDFWTTTNIPLRKLYERMYVFAEQRSYDIQTRNQRQAIRRALGRLHPTYVTATALAWVNVADQAVLWWQGGGSREGGPRGFDTPRWRMVGLTGEGVQMALLLEKESGQQAPAGEAK